MAVFLGVLVGGGLLDGNVSVCPGTWSVSPELGPTIVGGCEARPWPLLYVCYYYYHYHFLQQAWEVGIISASLWLR